MTRIRSADIDALVRSMDPATHAPPAHPTRAQADLERILAHNPPSAAPTPARLQRNGSTQVQPPVQPLAQQPVQVRRRRAVVLGGVVAAATAGLLVIPALSGGDPAFATWTAAPVALSGADRDDAVADCVSANKSTGDGMYTEDLVNAEVAIAERRGAWRTVVLAGADGFEATCVTDASAPWFDKGMVGSIGKLGAATDPAPRELKPTQLGTPVIMNQPLSMAAGRVGEEVAGITYTSIDGEDVIATVSQGQFAFWLPGDELQDAVDGGFTVEVTYVDGTTDTQELGL